jgi:hypothetical protein
MTSYRNSSAIGCYWTRIGWMLSSLNTSSWSLVGSAYSVQRCATRSGTRMLLRVSVPRCVMRPAKPMTRRPLASRLVAFLALPSSGSYGFRPGRSAQQAVAQAQAYVTEGHQFVVDIDLAKFFDRVNHDKLMARDGSVLTIGEERSALAAASPVSWNNSGARASRRCHST